MSRKQAKKRFRNLGRTDAIALCKSEAQMGVAFPTAQLMKRIKGALENAGVYLILNSYNPTKQDFQKLIEDLDDV